MQPMAPVVIEILDEGIQGVRKKWRFCTGLSANLCNVVGSLPGLHAWALSGRADCVKTPSIVRIAYGSECVAPNCVSVYAIPDLARQAEQGRLPRVVRDAASHQRVIMRKHRRTHIACLQAVGLSSLTGAAGRPCARCLRDARVIFVVMFVTEVASFVRKRTGRCCRRRIGQKCGVSSCSATLMS